ncbi:MAG: FAD-dependent oxidoreductase, partial [Oscillospiraceae bacterium]|nr:FAD-dependent oxidoreductase [Oscillospiraceae bacterium]
PGLRLLDAESAYAMEPGLAPGLRHALFSPTTGTVNPWQLGIAACENAVHNGAQLRLNTKVEALHRDADGYLLETDRGSIRTCAVINCAGLNADRIQALAFPTEVRIVPTAGDYLVLDKNNVGKPMHILEYEPEEKAKGLTVVPTIEGSLLLGPSERDNTLDYATTADGLLWVREQAARLLPGLDLDGTIRSFAAVRPNPEQADGRSIHSFCIEHPAERFWSLIGIKTPGLTCARELGQYVAAELARELHAEENTDFDPLRRAIQKAHALSIDERQMLAAAQPDYGEIICCCEDVTRGEILEAIRRGACTVDGVKRRVGTGMGRCQGARCQQKITEILSRELAIPEDTVTKDGKGTEIFHHGAC